MLRIIVIRSILILAALGSPSAQSMNPVERPPHIVIKLPDNIASDSVTIWYGLLGQQGRTELAKREPNVRQYTINAAIGGHPAHYATVYVYTPGCEFKTYDFELQDAFDVEQSFECAPLPTKVVKGLLAPAEMPVAKSSTQRDLEVVGYLEANWMCSDVFSRDAVRSQNFGGGSCFVPEIRLGSVGTFNVSDGGKLEIKIPDFTKDPAFRSPIKATPALDWGWIELAIRDKRGGRVLEAIEEKIANNSKHGLVVRSEYPDPIVFDRVVN